MSAVDCRGSVRTAITTSWRLPPSTSQQLCLSTYIVMMQHACCSRRQRAHQQSSRRPLTRASVHRLPRWQACLRLCRQRRCDRCADVQRRCRRGAATSSTCRQPRAPSTRCSSTPALGMCTTSARRCGRRAGCCGPAATSSSVTLWAGGCIHTHMSYDTARAPPQAAAVGWDPRKPESQTMRTAAAVCGACMRRHNMLLPCTACPHKPFVDIQAISLGEP